MGGRSLRLPLLSVAALLALVAMIYVPWWAYLTVAGTGTTMTPPTWRDPEIPSGVELVRTTTECGSGGCSRVLVLRPSDDQTPEELADEMGLARSVEQGWRWYDPHPVTVESAARGGALRVYVSYRTGV